MSKTIEDEVGEFKKWFEGNAMLGICGTRDTKTYQNWLRQSYARIEAAKEREVLERVREKIIKLPYTNDERGGRWLLIDNLTTLLTIK